MSQAFTLKQEREGKQGMGEGEGGNYPGALTSSARNVQY